MRRGANKNRAVHLTEWDSGKRVAGIYMVDYHLPAERRAAHLKGRDSGQKESEYISIRLPTNLFPWIINSNVVETLRKRDNNQQGE